MLKVIVVGDPFDGMWILGPFDDDHEDPCLYAERHVDWGNWWVVPVQTPDPPPEPL